MIWVDVADLEVVRSETQQAKTQLSLKTRSQDLGRNMLGFGNNFLCLDGISMLMTSCDFLWIEIISRMKRLCELSRIFIAIFKTEVF